MSDHALNYPEVFQNKKLHNRYSIKNSEPKVIFTWERFVQLMLGSVDQFYEDMEVIRNHFKIDLGLEKFNVKFVVNINNKEYGFFIYPRKYMSEIIFYAINVWNRNYIVNKESIPFTMEKRKEFLDELLEKILETTRHDA